MSVRPVPGLEARPSSQICLPSNAGMPVYLYTQEVISLILVVAILVRAIRGNGKRE
ncbi:MAG: hypothetical protein MUF49_31150 [Oculatellaceae cyanobacterium Prado106]|nr:hypothetical protein [Oculatellaceae cyanobacterium Prado106]